MKFYRTLAFICISLFIFLCFFHYFSQRPLWGDEKFILNNINSLSFSRIFGPLHNNQAFPRGYLAVIKLFSSWFNYQILALRFFPLVCMLSAFFIWRKLYLKTLINPWLSLLALFSLTSSYYFSYYAAELKQYSMDVLVVGIFCLYLSYQGQLVSRQPSKMFITVTLLLPFSLFVSYTSFLVFWLVIYNFLFIIPRNRKIVYLLLAYSLICLLTGASVYWLDLRHNFASCGLFSYWNDYFICSNSGYYFFKSLGEGLRKFATWWFGNNDFLKRSASFVIPFFIVSLFTSGFKALRKSPDRLVSLDSLGLIIFLELFILGILKKYPFTGERVTLFFAPFVFYFIIKGIFWLRRVRPAYQFFIISYLVLVLGCSLNSFLSYLRLYL